MIDPNKKRESFSSGLAIFFATLGSAVGLGNIWKFPYLVGENGGGAFVLIYLTSILLVGLPVMISEFYIGRKTKSNAVAAFAKLKVSPFWNIIGYMGIIAALFIMFFYSSVAGWVYSYVFKTIKGEFFNLGNLPIEDATEIVINKFSTTVSGSYSPIIWQGIVLLVVSLILIAGVKNGIEKITKTLMPILFILLILCSIRALTLKGAKEGLSFLFSIDFSKIKPSVILAALGLAFFKLSLGMGTMITYGSYFTDNNNMIYTSAKVALSDTLVSGLAGIAIFPVVFTFGLAPDSGPGLLFSTIPLVFSKIPFGNILLIAFFILASIAATTAMISMVEVPVAFMSEEWNIKRKYAVIIISGIIFSVGALTVHPTSIFGEFTLFKKNFFDLFDFISSNIMLPIGGLLIAIFVGYFANKDSIIDELSNGHKLSNLRIINIYYFILKYISPLLLLIVLLNSIGII
ncbi:sodium-dependent transporter [Tissierella praeacuta]|uniref:sodium-dependent transporter n=1 Tax=Tissierella praeacuta TaxID=43131 RepID=UPI001047885E|nr:sodium-dependent transporter [Tissierella praeacuta]TCU75807.1 NSS family neurotransmitter:Na+ symporter [Tissierella praeacuta]